MTYLLNTTAALSMRIVQVIKKFSLTATYLFFITSNKTTPSDNMMFHCGQYYLQNCFGSFASCAAKHDFAKEAVLKMARQAGHDEDQG